MGRVNHSKCKKNKQYKKHHDTKRRGRDIDQIQDDLIKGDNGAKIEFEVDDDLPGLGQFYCIQCARHFTDSETLQIHSKTRPHMRRLKDLAQEQYGQSEAEFGVGISKEILPKLRNKVQEVSANISM
eukprot:gene11131-23267_t